MKNDTKVKVTTSEQCPLPQTGTNEIFQVANNNNNLANGRELFVRLAAIDSDHDLSLITAVYMELILLYANRRTLRVVEYTNLRLVSRADWPMSRADLAGLQS